MTTDVSPPLPPASDVETASGPGPADAAAGRTVARRSALNRRFAALIRWLHIYVSMLAFTIVLFFSVTGLTLNHTDWMLGGRETRNEEQGTLELRWLHSASSSPGDAADSQDKSDLAIDKLEVVEHLRKTHDIRGALAEFTADDQQCLVAFKGPGYSADAYIDRETGKYDLVETRHGYVAVMNDLHKGRDTGGVWSWVIDISAIVTAFISVTGLVLIFYLKQRRKPGLILAALGTIVVIALFWFWVP